MDKAVKPISRHATMQMDRLSHLTALFKKNNERIYFILLELYLIVFVFQYAHFSFHLHRIIRYSPIITARNTVEQVPIIGTYFC